jgi:hypothetical protein
MARNAVNAFDAAEAAGLCECGTPLDSHPPLPQPKPLTSWHSQRNLDAEMGAIARHNGGGRVFNPALNPKMRRKMA